MVSFKAFLAWKPETIFEQIVTSLFVNEALLEGEVSMSIKRPVQQLSVLASALALSFGLNATSAAANDVVTVVDPSPVNWLWITWNTMEETVRVNSDGRSTPSLAEKQTWLDDKTLQIKLRKNVEFQDGEKLNATTFRRSYDEVQKWVNPHPPGAFLNYSKDSSMEVVDDYTINFKFPEPDGSAIMKLRGMHVGSTKFWNELAFVDQKKKNAEGHW